MTLLGITALWPPLQQGLRVCARYLLVLLASVGFITYTLLQSLPADLFKQSSVPLVNLALVLPQAEGDLFAQTVANELRNLEYVQQLSLFTKPEPARELLTNNQVAAIITLPPGLGNSLATGQHAVISVEVNDGLTGTGIYQVVSSAVEAFDSVQNSSLAYREAARPFFQNDTDYWDAVTAFNATLIGVALSRVSDIASSVVIPVLYKQTITLLFFFIALVAACFAAIIAARWYATGYVRRLALHGVGFWPLLLVWLLVACLCAAVLALVSGIAVRLTVGSLFDVPAAILSCLVLSVTLTPLILLLSGFRSNASTATTRVLLGCLSLAFFLLFCGGGFYPSFHWGGVLQYVSPVGLAGLLAYATLGGEITLVHSFWLALPLALGILGSRFEWRRAL